MAPFPLLGALLGGAQLLGAAVAGRRNMRDGAAIEDLQQQNVALLDGYEDRYGTLFDASTAEAGVGADMYANALGLNGAAGNAAAAAAYQASPGYQWSVEQALQAMLRGASAGGMLASGNTLTAATELGHNLANQDFGAWRGALSPYLQLEQSGLESQAALGSLITEGRLENNNAGIDWRQAAINNRRGVMGSLLGGAGTIFGNMAGYGSYGG
ncbi:MAG: hypothetical protein KIT43_10200 [Bauldia sp.]|nr:hypothetical protein [Bauldia sp.]MCW5718832.1 hypothetical protein [Bauldia sp.]